MNLREFLFFTNPHLQNLTPTSQPRTHVNSSPFARPCYTLLYLHLNTDQCPFIVASLRFNVPYVFYLRFASFQRVLMTLDRRFASFYSPCGLNTLDHSCSDLLRVLAFRKYKTKKGKKKLLVWSVEPDGYWEML